MFGDMGKLMKQAAEMKSNMAKTEKELRKLVVTGTSKDGKVEIQLNGKMDLRSISIPENKELEKAVREAFEQAMRDVSKVAAEKLKAATGGINIPGLM